MKRAVIYARFSSHNQTEQSIEGQVRVCTNYCQQHDMEVVGTYVDRAISGKTDKRPDFLRMISDSKKRIFDAVVVYRTDRFARNKYDSAVYKRELRQNGVEIHYAAEAMPDGPEAIILESLMEGMAEYYSAELGQKVLRGLMESARKCKVTGTIPFGFKATPDHHYEINADQAKVIREAFSMLLNNKSYTDIARHMNSLGYHTTAGGPFTHKTIVKMFRNRKYVGEYKYADHIVENGIPAIVDPETFALAQKEIDRRKSTKVGQPKVGDYLLRGKLFCGHCKTEMQGTSGYGKYKQVYYYYMCPTRRNHGECNKRNIPKDKIETAIVETTRRYLSDEQILRGIAQRVFASQELEEQNQLLQDAELRLQNIKKSQRNLVAALESGLDPSAIKDRLSELEQARKTALDDIAYIKSTSFTLTEDQIFFALKAYIDREDLSEEEYRKKIINAFISKVYVYDDKIIIYYNLRKGQSLTDHELQSIEQKFEGYARSITKDDSGRTRPESFCFVHGFALLNLVEETA